MTTNRTTLFVLDSNGDPLEVLRFPFVEDAMAAAKEKAGEPLTEWGDTALGYEALPESGLQALHEKGEYPSRYFQILGYDEETGEDREVDEDDHRE